MEAVSPMDGLQKSAIIYRDDSARFIYVCFHCGSMFKEINETLQHIESHFQLVKVIVDNADDAFGAVSAAPEKVDIKVEFTDDYEDTSKFLTEMNEPPQYKSVDVKYLENDDTPKNDRVKKMPTSEKPLPNKKREKKLDTPYRCHKCKTRCRNVTLLRNHLKQHDDGLLSVSKCKVCDTFFQDSCALRIHVLTEHLKKKRLKCNACAAEFSGAQGRPFIDHLRKHCEQDKKLWTNLRDGINHKSSDEFTSYEEIDSFSDEQYPCEFCSQRFYIKYNLDVHMGLLHSNQRRLQCGQCSAIFATPKYYYAHQLGHQKFGPKLADDDEALWLSDLDALIDERVIYHGSESEHPFRCLICNSTAEANHDIRSHIRRKHVYKMFPPPVEPKKEYICDYCGTMVKTKYAMKQHFQIHTNTKKYPCSHCGKMFRVASTRKIHERQHTGEKPYQCHECGKAFISRGLLTAHKRTHEDTRYPCHICGKTFNLPTGYRNHIKTHRVDRPYKCTICPKTFNTRIYLGRHMVIHSDKKYKCHYCESEFNTSDGRRQHHKHRHKFELGLM